MQKTEDGCTGRVLGAQAIERSVALYAIYTVHIEMRRVGFFVELQNQGGRFVSGLASKPLGRFISGLASKSLGRFSLACPQNWW
jgi:hypothetical protein